MVVTYPVDIPSGCPFPIQNIPFGIFSTQQGRGRGLQRRAGVAVGNHVLDLHVLVENGIFAEATWSRPLDNIFLASDLNTFASLPASERSHVRALVIENLRNESSALFRKTALNEQAFVAMDDVQTHLPMTITDYTDFFSSYVHAQNCLHPLGFDIPAAFHEYPMAYNGRISSVSISGTPVHRPRGFFPSKKDSSHPSYQPSQQLDFEVEMAALIATPVEPGTTVNADNAAEHIFGYVLLNDWSARDVQKYEMAPFGPFHSKSFLTSISPWVVTLDALKDSRSERLDSLASPHLAPMLRCHDRDHGLFDVELTATLSRHDSPSVDILETNLNSSHWSPYQMIAYQSSSGCGLRTGDLLGTGTLSCSPTTIHQPSSNSNRNITKTEQQQTPHAATYGCLTEIHACSHQLPEVGGKPVVWLEDGDRFSYEGWFRTADGGRAGFGGVSGLVVPTRFMGHMEAETVILRPTLENL